MRISYVWCKEQGKLVERGQQIRKFMGAPFIIQDTINAQQHPGTCMYTDSRSQFNRMTKACGLTERGPEKMKNEPVMKDMDSDSFARDVKIAYEQCKSGTAPISEYDREKFKRIEERIRNR